MTNFLDIDGAWGEGGGQILRTSLTLSILTGRPFVLKRIRHNRSKPGLARQHMTAIEAAAEIAKADIEGVHLRSDTIRFVPHENKAGNYCFQVSTAGSMPLVFQTVVLPLAFADGPSEISFIGGTHVPMSPPFEFLFDIWGRIARTMGLEVEFHIEKAGYYPKGGGIFHVKISPLKEQKLKGIALLERPPLEALELSCILSELPRHIARREKDTVEETLKERGIDAEIKTKLVEYPSIGPGNMLFLRAQFGKLHMGFSAMGSRGKRAEEVATDLCDEFWRFYQTDAAVEEHFADQLLLLGAVAEGKTKYRVSRVSSHLLTNAHVINYFTDAKIDIQGKEGKPGTVTIKQ